MDPGSIIGIIGSSIGLAVTLVKLAGKSVKVPRSRQHLLEVQKRMRRLVRKLRKAEDEVSLLDGVESGVHYLRKDTQNLINHSYFQIQKFERFYNAFDASRTVRGSHYIAISARKDDIQKYDRRFAMYSDWIVIAQLSISLAGYTSVTASHKSDVKWLRDKLADVERTKEEQSERLRKLRVNKGVNLERLEEYARGLLSLPFFDDSDASMTSSSVAVDDLPASTWERGRGYGQARKSHPPTNRSNRTTFMHHDHVYDISRETPNLHTPSTRSRRDAERSQGDKRYNYSRSRSRTEDIYPDLSGSRRSSMPIPDSGYDDHRARGGRRSRERHQHSTSNDRADTMTSGFGRSKSVESSQHSRRRGRSRSPSSKTHTRSHSRQSYHSRHDSGYESRGRDTHRLNFQDTHQNSSSPSRYRSQSRSSHFSRDTDERQGQQPRDDSASIEIRPSERRHRSRSRDTNVSFVPSHDSGYGSLDPETYSSSASIASTDRQSGSRKRPNDRSGPPIALDRAERGIRKAEERTRRKGRGATPSPATQQI
ncbi:hypothetical protein GGR51DRAFT_558389 [Nemania sp. FL0031]|nr:hypothetical protein GGR51DRAFT_558389 [Nemania sp. FL0031]